MTWHETADVEQFLAEAGDLMLTDPGLHTVSLTVCENVRARPDGTRFAWWTQQDGDVTGAVSQTPPYPLLLTAVPDEAVGPLVELFAPQAVNGPTALAAQVATVSARRRGGTVTLRNAQRLHRLGELRPPATPGAPRLATDDDRGLLVEWFDAFITETAVLPQDTEATVRDRLAFGGLVLWEDGGPVAMAGRSRTAFGSVRLGPVYTPPGQRGRGYGGAVTAASAQQALGDGAWDVVLFTDLTNPTSNALYRRLGFAPVMDRAIMEISP